MKCCYEITISSLLVGPPLTGQPLLPEYNAH